MTEQTRARRRLTWRGKLLLAVGAPAVVLCLGELVLAIVGFQPREVPAPCDTFSARKARGTVRIMVVGGSAAAGYPFMPRGGPAQFLRELLRDVAPGQRTEVLNCGVAALASEGLVILVRKLVDYQPDCLILYAGHNEFFNLPNVNRTVAQWEPEPPSWVRRTRMFSLLQDMGTLVRGGPPPQERVTRAEQGAMGTIGTPANYRPGTLAAPFEARLREIVRLAGERGVRVLLSTPASNLRDVPPPCPKHRAGLSAEQMAAWQRAYDDGRRLLAEGHREAASAAFSNAAAIDAEEAGLLYDQARCLSALGKTAEAKKLFVAARDRDYMPMRATSPIIDAMRRVAEELGVTLVESEAAFAEASPGGVPGDEWFLDHVHLTPRGAMLLAECWGRGLERAGVLGERAGWDWSRARTQSAYEKALDLTPIFLAQGYLWIGEQCARAEKGGRLVEGYRRAQFVEHARERGSRMMAKALELDPQADAVLRSQRDPYALCYLGDAYLRLGQADRAARICQEVVDACPTFALGLGCLARAYSQSGDAERSAQTRERLAKIEGSQAGGDWRREANQNQEMRP